MRARCSLEKRVARDSAPVQELVGRVGLDSHGLRRPNTARPSIGVFDVTAATNFVRQDLGAVFLGHKSPLWKGDTLSTAAQEKARLPRIRRKGPKILV